MMAGRRWKGRRFSDEERRLAFQRIVEGVAFYDAPSSANTSPRSTAKLTPSTAVTAA